MKCFVEEGPQGWPSLPGTNEADMTQASHQCKVPALMPRRTAPPTAPGVYWFQTETMHREMMVTVRLTNGQLTAWWLNRDEPVANMNGSWRGPIASFNTTETR